MRVIRFIVMTAVGVALMIAVEDLDLILQVPIVVGAFVAAFLVLLVSVISRALNANGGQVNYVDVAETEHDEELLATVSELEQLGFRRSDRVLRPIGSNYCVRAVVVLLFNEDRTVVANVARMCGPLTASYWSVFDVGADDEANLWTLQGRTYDPAGPYELRQCYVNAGLATRRDEHDRAVQVVSALGLAPRPMDVEACIASLTTSFTQSRARLLQSLTGNVLRMYGRALLRKSRNEGPIELQREGQSVMNRIAGRA